MSPLLFCFLFFPGSFLCYFVYCVHLSCVWPPALQFRLPALLFVCILFVLLVLFVVVLSAEPKQNHGRGLVDRKLVQARPPRPRPPVILLLAVAKRLFCFGSLVVLDVVFRYLSLSLLYINTQIGPGRVAQSVGHLTHKSVVLGSIPGLATYFRFSFRFFKKGSCQLLAKVCARSTG